MSERRVVIVGGGQAGARTAQALRREGWQDEIMLLAAEPVLPYERPPLSKDVLTKDEDPSRYTILTRDIARDLSIQVRVACTVDRLDLPGRRVRMAGGGRVDFDHLVLATGTAPRDLPTPGGAQFPNVVTLRTEWDARRLRPMLSGGGKVVMIGGGFIGLEVAASAIAFGCSVTVLEAESQIMGRMISPDMAEQLARIHRARGVRIRTGVRVEAFEGIENVRRVLLSNGKTVEADVVVIGVGATPQDSLARLAGIECMNGVLVDETGETSVPGVYAVGDVARYRRFWGGTRNIRIESWENAELQPKDVARAITGKTSEVRGAPWFWTDQHGNNIQILGFRGGGDATVLRGDPGGGAWAQFTLREGRVIAAVLMNSGRDRRPTKKLIDEGLVVDPAALADPDTPLASLGELAAPLRAGSGHGA